MTLPTDVWVILHDDGIDAGMRIIAVYATREAAERDLVTRTPSGAPSRAWDAHSARCCVIEEWEVLS